MRGRHAASFSGAGSVSLSGSPTIHDFQVCAPTPLVAACPPTCQPSGDPYDNDLFLRLASVSANCPTPLDLIFSEAGLPSGSLRLPLAPLRFQYFPDVMCLHRTKVI